MSKRRFMVPVRGFVRTSVARQANEKNVSDMGSASVPGAVGWYLWYLQLPAVKN